MKSSLRTKLFLIFLCTALINDLNGENSFNPLTFLQSNGYGLGLAERESLLATPNAKVSSFNENPQLKNMISLFQRLHHLEITGKLDNKTLTKMKSPRCGFPDIVHGASKNSYGTPVVAAFTAVAKWNRMNLTYRILNSSIDLKESGNSHAAIKQGFQYWADVTDLTFTEVCSSCKADFTIKFVEKDHDDGYPFDGQGGVLAHAFFPSDGRIHFDIAEPFTENVEHGINLRLVAAHEIGHALGLEHSFVQGALMYPYYSGYLKDFVLPNDDILGIQSLYGKKSASTSASTTSTTTLSSSTTTTTTQSSKASSSSTRTSSTTTSPKSTTRLFNSFDPSQIPACSKSVGAVFFSPKKENIYAIVDHSNLWEYDLFKNNWQKRDLFSLYPNISSGVRGGVRCNRNYTWFFKGKRVWSYDGYKLRQGFPKRIIDPIFPNNPYTAVKKGDQIFVLKGSFAYRFDTNTLEITDNHPGYVKNVFPGVPDWIEAALDYDGYHYLFKNLWVYKFNEKKNKVESTPVIKYDAWMPCFRKKMDNQLKIPQPVYDISDKLTFKIIKKGKHP